MHDAYKRIAVNVMIPCEPLSAVVVIAPLPRQRRFPFHRHKSAPRASRIWGVLSRIVVALGLFCGACGEYAPSDADGETNALANEHAVAAGGQAAGHAGPPHARCGEPYPPDPRDDTMTGEPVRVPVDRSGVEPAEQAFDLLLPQEMRDWLAEKNWLQAHGDWHYVRFWDYFLCRNTVPGLPCRDGRVLNARGLERAPVQIGQRGDGYAFLLMHRHMLRALREAFPKHADLLRPFREIPIGRDHPENLFPFHEMHWRDEEIASIAVMENIDEHLQLFEDEDDYGLWVQWGDFPAFVRKRAPGAPAREEGNIHSALHTRMEIPGSASSLNDHYRNLQNLAFWRLHAWVDAKWEQYRSASGLREDDPSYRAALAAQCEEMHALSRAAPRPIIRDWDPELERGVFATEVMPILEGTCAACHDRMMPEAGLTLGDVAPSVVWKTLRERMSTQVPLPLVSPGDPSKSWLYKKLTGSFFDVECVACQTIMPQVLELDPGPIERIRAWIADGAPL